MITLSQHKNLKRLAAALIKDAGVILTEDELARMDTADFGLGAPEVEGAQIASLIDTEKIAMRVIALLPGQTEPEHRHAGAGDCAGKEETIRVLAGMFYLCVEGDDNLRFARVPPGKDQFYTARREYAMQPGDCLTIPPGVRHWFQAGGGGAVVYSVSTTATDAKDLFTDPAVRRVTEIRE